MSSESESIDSSDIEELPRPDLNNADVKYQTAEELLRQKDHARDQKTKLMASYQTAGPEERQAIEVEVTQLAERIDLLHKTAKVRNNEEIEDIFRQLRDMKEREKEFTPEKVNQSQSRSGSRDEGPARAKSVGDEEVQPTASKRGG